MDVEEALVRPRDIVEGNGERGKCFGFGGLGFSNRLCASYVDFPLNSTLRRLLTLDILDQSHLISFSHPVPSFPPPEDL